MTLLDFAADRSVAICHAAESRPGRAAINLYLLHAGPTAANPLHCTLLQWSITGTENLRNEMTLYSYIEDRSVHETK